MDTKMQTKKTVNKSSVSMYETLYEKTKIFKDNVHGYIRVPECYVKSFVDTGLFQRLRYIEQTGMRMLYPSARHDRFIHSLGTYHIGNKAATFFRKNVEIYYNKNKDTKGNDKRGDYYNVFSNLEKTKAFWDKCQILFEIACLLHDCGHAPFSHTLEFLYEQEKKDDKGPSDLAKTLAKFFELSGDFQTDFLERKAERNYKPIGTEHERMSALLVVAEYKEAIDKVINDLMTITQNKPIEGDDDSLNVEFVARMIIGCKYTNKSEQNNIRNCFIDLLNSESIDVDSLDYIVRDSKLSGIDNMSIDLERLLGALTIVEITKFSKATRPELILENNIDKVDLQAPKKGKAKFEGRCIGKIGIQKNFKAKIYGDLNLNGHFMLSQDNKCDVLKLKEKGVQVKLNGYVVGPDTLTTRTEPSDFAIIGSFSREDSISIEGDSIIFDAETDCTICIESTDSIRFTSALVKGAFYGEFSGKVLGNLNIKGEKPTCELGYNKSALSVIQNVITARNHEYQWIYTHHKVVYYSNFLIRELLKKSIAFYNVSTNKLAEMISLKTMLDRKKYAVEFGAEVFFMKKQPFYRIVDSDIIALFRRCYLDKNIDSEENLDFLELLDEFHTRNYRRSLWKSQAEFGMFFSNLTAGERKRLFDVVTTHEKTGNLAYGYFNKT
jgi:HD superfamily phosphohydrolase